MDRNTVIGFVLLAILLFLYLFISSKESQEASKLRKAYDDSIAIVNSIKKSQAPVLTDTVKTVVKDTAGFKKALYGEEQLMTVENNLIKIVFTNKGGRPASVHLKSYHSHDQDSTQVQMLSEEDKISYLINTGPNQSTQVTDLYFSAGNLVKNPNGDQVVTYLLTGPTGEVLTHQYIIPSNSYAIDWNIQSDAVGKLFSQGHLNINWHAQPVQHEKYSTIERQATNTNICFSENNEFDYISSKTEKKFEKPVQWISVSQQFFSTILRAKESFNSGEVHWVRETADTSHLIAKVDANFQAKFPANSIIALQLYYGPNDYYILKKQAPEMDRIVNLGRDMYSFVRPVNVYIIMPVFNFFKKFIESYGLVILLLTLFIRLLTSPLIYKSYLSGAKMKVLRPEMDILKKKHGTDQQAYGMEQMKLFREAGVNPLGGCIPALLQIPIFFALYSFFNSNIALRGQSFLWAKDLSVYDSIVNLGFSIPFYGNHVSLFTLLAVVTSFLISLYGMSNAPDQNNPALKYMPYIFPVLLLGFFNKLPSALTWYYTVSNVITLVMQWVIQTYIIDHDKILAKIEETRKKPKTKSKWQERMEQMQKTQQKLPPQKSKSPGK
ncbi:MAG: membrane protein insertase YidC [Chitinophagaceae bacterium]